MKDKKLDIIQIAKMAEVGTFTVMLIHELKQPLFAIKSFSEMLLKDETDEKRRKKLEIILAQAMRMEEMMKKIREFSRKGDEKEESISLKEVMESVRVLISYRLEKRGVKFIEDIHDELPNVSGNKNHFEQVFLNLIDNALDAVEGKEKGMVGVKGVSEDNWVLIYLFDNGKGIPEEDREQIFEMFYTTKEDDKGTGLGLPICREILNMYGGEIVLEKDLPAVLKDYAPVTVFRLKFKRKKDD